MKGLAALLSVLAPLTVIVTGWWNLVIRRRVAEARIDAAKRGVVERVRVESTFARTMRRIITATVVGVLVLAALVGAAILLKSIWELF